MPRRFFQPKLVNGPAGDPALFVELAGEGRALLFDLGRVDRLRPAELLRVSDVFVTHAHIDHFIGFDHLLRISLGHDKRLRFFGPPGFFTNVEGKLAAYTWNLVEGQTFEIEVCECRGDRLHRRRYPCGEGFRAAAEEEVVAIREGRILAERKFDVFSETLDHRIPCLGFAVRERKRINVDADRLEASGLQPGPWVGRLKTAVEEGWDEDTAIRVGEAEMTLGELRSRLVRITPGDRLAYVADAGFTEENQEKIVRLASGAGRFFCEGGLLSADEERALANRHLTAAQAGRLARRAGAEDLTVFHFSPKYAGRHEELMEDAQGAFRGQGR